MVGKKPSIPDANQSPFDRQDQSKPRRKVSKKPTEPVAVDRPGFDLGGSTGKTSSGTGLGIGQDASENRNDRSLPGRRKKNK